jgi:hypothetical protein
MMLANAIAIGAQRHHTVLPTSIPDCYGWWSTPHNGVGSVTADNASAPALASWSVFGTLTRTDNTTDVTDPLGGNTATKLVEVAGTANHLIYVASMTNVVAGPTIVAWYMRPQGTARYGHFGRYNNLYAEFDMLAPGAASLIVGSGATPAIAAVGDWWMCSLYNAAMPTGEWDLYGGIASSGISFAGDVGRGLYVWGPSCAQLRAAGASNILGMSARDLAATTANQPFRRVDAASPGGVGFSGQDLWQPNAGQPKTLSNADATLLSLHASSSAFTVCIIVDVLAFALTTVLWKVAAGTAIGRNGSNQWTYQRAGGTTVAGGSVTAGRHVLVLSDNGTTCSLWDNGVSVWTAQSHGAGSITPASFDWIVDGTAATELWGYSRALSTDEAIAQSDAAMVRRP